jgi:hypothetical protein
MEACDTLGQSELMFPIQEEQIQKALLIAESMGFKQCP